MKFDSASGTNVIKSHLMKEEKNKSTANEEEICKLIDRKQQQKLDRKFIFFGDLMAVFLFVYFIIWQR